MCVGPPYDGSLELRLGVMHDVLQDPPQRNWDGQKDKNSGDEPGFAVSPDLQNRSKTPHEPLFWSGHGNRPVLEAYLVFLELPDTEGQHCNQEETVKNQNQRADPPSPLCPWTWHDDQEVNYRTR